ncbi:MAG: NADP-dependent oxidoreductase [Burkholderiaceae bacterium]
MAQTFRRVALARYLHGLPQADDFSILTEPLPQPSHGELLICNIYASIDPGTRARLSQGPSYLPPLKLGETVGAFNLGQVLESRNPRFAHGDLVTWTCGWAEAGISNGRGYLARITDRSVPLAAWIGVLGIPGLTAYFGLSRLGQIAAGETVVVTSAAGMVGATAAQIAKLRGCRVVAVAGGPVKCAWLRDELGIEQVVDHKAAADLGAAIAACCPDGVDVLFDNVGNASVDAILPLMRMNGRIVVSGQVGDYNLAGDQVHGIRNTRPFITHRVRMQGLVVFDDLREFPAAQAELAGWLKVGKLKYREVRYQGLEQAPRAFRDVFEGRDFGRHLLQLAPEPAGAAA